MGPAETRHHYLRFAGSAEGNCDTEVAATKACDRKAVERFGKFAYLNFPEEICKYASNQR